MGQLTWILQNNTYQEIRAENGDFYNNILINYYPDNKIKDWIWQNQDGNSKASKSYSYDSLSNQSEVLYQGVDSTYNFHWTYEYKYNENNDWIKKVKSIDNNTKIIVERNLVYF